MEKGVRTFVNSARSFLSGEREPDQHGTFRGNALQRTPAQRRDDELERRITRAETNRRRHLDLEAAARSNPTGGESGILQPLIQVSDVERNGSHENEPEVSAGDRDGEPEAAEGALRRSNEESELTDEDLRQRFLGIESRYSSLIYAVRELEEGTRDEVKQLREGVGRLTELVSMTLLGSQPPPVDRPTETTRADGLGTTNEEEFIGSSPPVAQAESAWSDPAEVENGSGRRETMVFKPSVSRVPNRGVAGASRAGPRDAPTMGARPKNSGSEDTDDRVKRLETELLRVANDLKEERWKHEQVKRAMRAEREKQWSEDDKEAKLAEAMDRIAGLEITLRE
jgi:hypothetical protein